MCLQTSPIRCCWLFLPVRCCWRCTAWAYRHISSPFLTASTVLWCAVGFWKPSWWRQRSCHPSAFLCYAAYVCSASSRSPGMCSRRTCVCVFIVSCGVWLCINSDCPFSGTGTLSVIWWHLCWTRCVRLHPCFCCSSCSSSSSVCLECSFLVASSTSMRRAAAPLTISPSLSSPSFRFCHSLNHSTHSQLKSLNRTHVWHEFILCL